MADQDLSGRVALVTGGSRGIGRAICRRLARAGAWLAINHSSSHDAAAETLDQVRNKGGEGGIYRADVASFEAIDAMFRAIESDRGAVDLLVTNAGIASFQDSVDMPVDLWRRTRIKSRRLIRSPRRRAGGRIDGGIVMPSCCAVFMLTARMNLEGSTTGSSATLAPWRIR